MKYNNKSFQERYEAWKNGADYWKDIRGVNLGGKAQEDEPSEEERQQINAKVNSILNAYSTGKDSAFTYDIAKDMNSPVPFDAPLSQELPRFKGGKSRAITAEQFYNEMVAGGVDPILAAGIAGNVQQESSFNPDSISPGGKYRGYAQLSPDLVNYVRAAYGGYDHAHQMQFLIDMAKGSPRAIKGNTTYNDMLNRAKAFTGGTYVTPQSAAFGWEKSFERSGGQQASKRMQYANDIYTKYHKASKPAPIKTAAETLEDPAQIPVIMPKVRESAVGQYIPVESANVVANESDRQIYDRMMTQARRQILEPVPMPNAIQNMLQGNNRGKDGYGQKFWQRRGANLHFKGGKDKQSYQDWCDKAEKYKGVNINGDNTYDYRAFYNEDPSRAYALLNGDPGAHFVDKFKTPYHPTFSDESVYSNASHPGGHWGRYDYRDAYYAPMFSYTNPGDRIGYLNMAEDNGVIPFMNNGSMYRVDGDLYGGVLPAVTVTGRRNKKWQVNLIH